MFEQNVKVGGIEGQSHAEHDDAQKPRNVRADPFEGIGCGKSDAGKECGPEGKGLSDKTTDFVEGIHDDVVKLFLREVKDTRLNLNLQNDLKIDQSV